jgi:hypothetical protein
MAKKSKEFSELVRQQKREKASNRSFEKFQRSVKRDFGTDMQMITGQDGITKMSDVLKDFVSPYADIPQNMQEIRHLIETAVTAWDLALMPEGERIIMLDKIFVSMIKKAKKSIATSRALIEDLIDRKLKYFADNQRRVIDFQVEDLGQDGYHLSVASTMPQ